MKKLIYFVVAAFALVAVGCSKDDVANEGVEYVSELKLNIGKGDTRVDVTHDPASGLKFAWEGGDEIDVVWNKKDKSVKLQYVYDASSASFKPKYEGDASKMQVGESYFAVMTPSSVCNVEYTGTDDVQVELKMDGNIQMEQLPMISDVFTATNDMSGTIATMHHLVGMVEIPVKLKEGAVYSTVNNFTLFSSGGKLANNFIAKPMGEYIKDTSIGYDTAYENEGSYTLSTSTAKSIFIPVLPGTHSSVGLNYNYTNGIDAVSKQVNLGDITVARGMITKVAETTINPD